MRLLRLLLLYGLLLGCISCIIYVLSGANYQKFPLTIALLAVLAATVAALPSFRLLDLQEDALRPQAVPHFDFGSRHNLLQLRITNLGQTVAYDINIKWFEKMTDHNGHVVDALDSVQLILPRESASTLVGEARGKVQEFRGRTFSGLCTYRDARGTKYKEHFSLSVEGYGRRLIHDSELPKTLRELQDLPDRLDAIAGAITKLSSDSNKAKGN